MKLIHQIYLFLFAVAVASHIKTDGNNHSDVSSSSGSEVDQSLGSSPDNPLRGYKVAGLQAIEKFTNVHEDELAKSDSDSDKDKKKGIVIEGAKKVLKVLTESSGSGEIEESYIEKSDPIDRPYKSKEAGEEESEEDEEEDSEDGSKEEESGEEGEESGEEGKESGEDSEEMDEESEEETQVKSVQRPTQSQGFAALGNLYYYYYEMLGIFLAIILMLSLYLL